MSKEGEPPLQFDLFTGELVDNRTEAQKKRDKEAEKPKQGMMFSQRDMAQFGVDAHPKIPLSDHTKLGLLFEDHRTEEEIAADIQRQALEHNFRLFGEEGLVDQDQPEEGLNQETHHEERQ